MIKLQAEKRDIFGKNLEAERKAGRLPVVIYGAKEKATSYFVDRKIFNKIWREAGESSVVTIESPDGTKDVLIKEVARHPRTGESIHADFYAIEKGKKLTVNVPLEFIGNAPAVKELAGILIKVLHEVEVETLPKDLPHNLEVDTNSLVALDSQILVKDLKVPAGVEILTSGDEVVASITVAKDEPVEETPTDLDSIEVEKKGKKEEEGEVSGEESKE